MQKIKTISARSFFDANNFALLHVFSSQVKSSQLEIIPLSQDRLFDAVHILVWYPVDEIPDNEEGVIKLVDLVKKHFMQTRFHFKRKE